MHEEVGLGPLAKISRLVTAAAYLRQEVDVPGLPPLNYIKILRGSSSSWSLTVVNGDGSPFDLTGWEVYFVAKADPGDEAAALTRSSLTPGEFDVGDNPRLGIATLKFVPGDFVGVGPGQYGFEVWLFKDTDRIPVIERGRMDISAAMLRKP